MLFHITIAEPQLNQLIVLSGFHRALYQFSR
jgi:hypothetical protein